MTRENPQVKGLAFRSVLRSLRTLRGEEVTSRCLEHMPKELSEGLQYGSLSASSWYPIGWYRQLFQGICQGSGEGSGLVRQIGKESIRLDLNLVHKMLLKVLNPTTVFSATPRLFSNYYDTGFLKVLEARDGYTKAHWQECHGFDYAMWTEMFGSSEAILEAAGAKNVRLRRTRGGQDGDPEAIAEAHWNL